MNNFTQREAPYPKSAPQRLVDEAKGWVALPLEALKRKRDAEWRRGVTGHWAFDQTRCDLLAAVYRERVAAEPTKAKELETVS